MKLATVFSMVLALLLFNTSASAGFLDNLTKKEAPKSQAKPAQEGALVSSVMSQLGLSKTQAEGGLGSLLTVAKSNLGADKFSPIAKAIPGVDSLFAAVPALGGDSKVSGLISKAGNLGTSLKAGSQLYGLFEKLGISKQLTTPMIKILTNYLSTNSGEGTSNLLMQGFKTLM